MFRPWVELVLIGALASCSEVPAVGGAVGSAASGDGPDDSADSKDSEGESEGEPAVVGPPLAFTDITESSPDVMNHPHVAIEGWAGVDMYAPGLGLVDLDGDDVLDLIQPRCHRSDPGQRDVTLFAGVGDGTFGTAAVLPWNANDNPVGVVAFDYDADDDLDIFFAVDYGTSRLFRNDGGWVFVDVSGEAGVTLPGMRAYTAAAADVDGDDDLDLHVGIWNEGTLYEGSAPNVLFINQGDGTFVDGTDAAGVACNGWSTLGQAFADLDRDGDQDLYVANDFFADCLFENQGDGTFIDVAVDAGVDFGAKHAMGIAIGDLDGDGWLDIIVTDDGATDDSPGNPVYLSRGGGTLRYDDVSTEYGLDGTMSSALQWNVCWGTGIIDFDLDGDNDVHIATHVGRPELYWQRDDQGGYHDVIELFEPSADTRGSAYADIDADGDVDIVLGRRGLGLQVMRNDTAATSSSITVAIRPRWAAPGAEIRLVAGGHTQSAIVQAGSSYLSTSPLQYTFGLGEATTIDRVEVTFADGTTRTVDAPSPDTRIVVDREG